MHSYDSLRENHGRKVSQTVDQPILVFDYFELSDVFMALGVVLFFGVILYSWFLMILLLIISIGVLPVVKKRYPKGILYHYPYKKFGMSLPGLINPGERRKYSD